MRLIDADALRAGMCAECALVGEKCLGDECDWDSIKHIDKAPTVKAIPVVWLKGIRDIMQKQSSRAAADLLSRVIEMWENEQEGEA